MVFGLIASALFGDDDDDKKKKEEEEKKKKEEEKKKAAEKKKSTAEANKQRDNVNKKDDPPKKEKKEEDSGGLFGALGSLVGGVSDALFGDDDPKEKDKSSQQARDNTTTPEATAVEKKPEVKKKKKGGAVSRVMRALPELALATKEIDRTLAIAAGGPGVNTRRLRKLRKARVAAHANDVSEVNAVITKAPSIEIAMTDVATTQFQSQSETLVWRIVGAAELVCRAEDPPKFVNDVIGGAIKAGKSLHSAIGEKDTSIAKLLQKVLAALQATGESTKGGTELPSSDVAQALLNAANALFDAAAAQQFFSPTTLERTFLETGTDSSPPTILSTLTEVGAHAAADEDLDEVKKKIDALRKTTEDRATKLCTYNKCVTEADYQKYREALIVSLRKYVASVKSAAAELCKEELYAEWKDDLPEVDTQPPGPPAEVEAARKELRKKREDAEARRKKREEGDAANNPEEENEDEELLDLDFEIELDFDLTFSIDVPPEENEEGGEEGAAKFDCRTLENPSHLIPEAKKSSTPAVSDSQRALKWLRHVHKTAATCDAVRNSFSYTPQQIRMMLWKGVAVLNRVIDFLKHDKAQQDGELPLYYDFHGTDPLFVTLAESAIRSARHWAKLGVDPDHGADLLFVAYVYTVDMNDCDCSCLTECAKKLDEEKAKKQADVSYTKHCRRAAEPKNWDAHGSKCQPWAVANWSLRVAYDTAQPEATRKASLDTIEQVFAAFVERLDEALFLLPRKRDVVFRGVALPLSTKYALDTSVIFAPFTSTSLEGVAAEKFMKREADGTFFILRLHSAAMIDFVSWFPDQAEALCPTHTGFFVKGKTSRTMMQMLGCRYDIVTMSEIGGAHTNEQKARWVYESAKKTTFIYENYLDKYVDGRVSPNPPPQHVTTNIFEEVDQWVVKSVDTTPFMLLVGAGGSGKTSAALGCLSRMMEASNRKEEKPILPFFVPLPSVKNLLTEPGALDKHFKAILDLDDEGMNFLQANYTLVLLLDSLDEVPIGDLKVTDEVPYFMQMNPWTMKNKCIVSVRLEYFDRQETQSPPKLLARNSDLTDVFYVQPFSDEDMIAFIYKTKRNHQAPLGSKERKGAKLSEALSSAALADYRELLAIGIDSSALHHPCTLYIALIALMEGMEYFTKTRRSGISDLYEAFLRSQLVKASEQFQKNGLTVDAALEGLENVALSMLNGGRFEMTVGDFLKHFPGFSEDVARLVLVRTPRRCEDDNNARSAVSFWHKTVAEFLAARALVRRPSALSAIARTFTREVPMVQKFVEDMIIASTAMRQYVTSTLVPTWLKTVQDARRANKKSKADVSNALGLLTACRHVFDRDSTGKESSDLSGLVVSEANLTQGRFIHASCEKTVFDDCDVTVSMWDGSNVEKMELPECETGVQRAPIPVDAMRAIEEVRVSASTSRILVFDGSIIQIVDSETGDVVYKTGGNLFDANADFSRVIVQKTSVTFMLNVIDVESKKIIASFDQSQFLEQTGFIMKDYQFLLNLEGDCSEEEVADHEVKFGGATFVNNTNDIAVSVTMHGFSENKEAASHSMYSGVCIFAAKSTTAELLKISDDDDRSKAAYVKKVYESTSGEYHKWAVRTEKDGLFYIRPPLTERQNQQTMLFDIESNGPVACPPALLLLNASTSLSPDGKLVADWTGSESPRLIIIHGIVDGRAQTVRARLDHGAVEPSCARFSPSSQELISAAEDTCFVWNISSSSILAKRSVQGVVSAIAILNSKKFYTVSHDGEGRDHVIQQWSISASDQVTQFSTTRAKVMRAQGDAIFRLPRDLNVSNGLRVLLKSSQLTVGHQDGIVLPEVPSGSCPRQRRDCTVMALSNDGVWAVIGERRNHTVSVYNAKSNMVVQTYNLYDMYVNTNCPFFWRWSRAFFVPGYPDHAENGHGFKDGVAYGWAAHIHSDNAAITLVNILYGEGDSSDPPKYVVFDTYSLRHGKRDGAWTAHHGIITDFVFQESQGGGLFPLVSPLHHEQGFETHHGKWEILTSEGEVRKGKLAAPFTNLEINAFATSHKGDQLIKWKGNTAVVFQTVPDAKELFTIDHSSNGAGAVSSGCFTEDGSHVITTSDAMMLMTSVKSKAVIFKKSFDGEAPGFIACSAVNENLIAGVTKNRVAYVLRQGDRGAASWTLGAVQKEGHTKAIRFVSYVSSTNQIVTAGKDRYAILWDLGCGGREVSRVDANDRIVAIDVIEDPDESWYCVIFCEKTIICTDFDRTYNCRNILYEVSRGACLRSSSGAQFAVAVVCSDKCVKVVTIALPTLNVNGEMTVENASYGDDVVVFGNFNGVAMVLVRDDDQNPRGLIVGVNADGMIKRSSKLTIVSEGKSTDGGGDGVVPLPVAKTKHPVLVNRRHVKPGAAVELVSGKPSKAVYRLSLRGDASHAQLEFYPTLRPSKTSRVPSVQVLTNFSSYAVVRDPRFGNAVGSTLGVPQSISCNTVNGAILADEDDPIRHAFGVASQQHSATGPRALVLPKCDKGHQMVICQHKSKKMAEKLHDDSMISCSVEEQYTTSISCKKGFHSFKDWQGVGFVHCPECLLYNLCTGCAFELALSQQSEAEPGK